MTFEGAPHSQEHVVDMDLVHKLDPVDLSWSEAARKESLGRVVPARTFEHSWRAWTVTEDDTLEGDNRRLVLNDDEVEVLNVLLRHPESLPTATIQELLPDVNLREATHILLNRKLISNDARVPLSVRFAPSPPIKSYERTLSPRQFTTNALRSWADADSWSWSISPTVSIDDRRHEALPFKSFIEIQQELTQSGFAIVNDEMLGNFGQPFRQHLLNAYFNNPNVVKRHEHDIPNDRERARAVAEIAFLHEGAILSEHGTVPILSPSLYVGDHGNNAVEHRPDPRIIRPKEYSHLEIFRDPAMLQFMHNLNQLIPERHRPPFTTFGINAFRTRTNVVSSPHQDGVNYVFVYVVDVKGKIPRTKLYATDEDSYTPRPKVSHPLLPGQLIVFKDSLFYHYTADLIPGLDGVAQRDVIVFTADNPIPAR